MVFLQDGPPTTYKYWPITPLIRIITPSYPFIIAILPGLHITLHLQLPLTRSSSVDHFWLVKRQDADAQAALRAKLLELPTEAWHCQLNMQQLWIFGPPRRENLDVVGWKVTHFFCREYIFEGLYFHCHFWFSRGSRLKLKELKNPT